MRVAVYFGDILQTTGGGFTFQEDILRALLELKSPQRHSFIIYSHSHLNSSAGIERAPFEFQYIRWRHWSKFQLWLNTCFESLPYVADSLHLRGWFERSLRRREVDFAWFVSPTFFQ